MRDEELLSWLEYCPVCGEGLVRTIGSPYKLTCHTHGSFTIVNGVVIFELDTDTEYKD